MEHTQPRTTTDAHTFYKFMAKTDDKDSVSVKRYLAVLRLQKREGIVVVGFEISVLEYGLNIEFYLFPNEKTKIE